MNNCTVSPIGMLLRRGKGAKFDKYTFCTSVRSYLVAAKKGRSPAGTPSYHESQQRCHRWFTSIPNGDASSTANKIIKSNKMRERKPRPLSAINNSNAPRTTKERIRWLQDTNQSLAADNHYRRKAMERRIDDVGEVMEERLKWMRGKIYGFWQSDYEATAAAANHRPDRVGPKMDAKWWFWNVGFALFPAACIAAYCEFIGKPAMLDYNRQVYIREQKKLLGDAYVEEDDEELKRLTIESEPLSSKLYDAVYDLTSYFLGQIQPETQVQDMDNKDNSDQSTSSPLAVASIQQPHASNDAQTVAELKQKLEELERRINERHQSGSMKSPQILNNEQPIAATKNLSRIQDRALAQKQQEARQQRENNRSSMSESETNIDGIDGVISRGITQITDTVQKYWKVWFDNSLSSESGPRAMDEQADAAASSNSTVRQEIEHQKSQQRVPTEDLHTEKHSPAKESQSIERESGNKDRKPWYRRLF